VVIAILKIMKKDLAKREEKKYKNGLKKYYTGINYGYTFDLNCIAV
jgi:hypothetical protein